MKKLFLTGVAMLMALIAMPLTVKAQMQMPPLPVDSGVRIGKLPNGLTYYIRHNEKPKGQADFYIAQKVGSALEADNQRGLAHFLEHMCFNGTTHFPDNLLRDWLESIGVKFGANLNAYTGVDQTVYNISNVPIARTSVQDSCLLILHDWANDLTLDPKEIDKERGVIHQEWRRAMQGQMRILERVLPNMYPGTKYGHRLPIGTMEVVDNFPPKALRDYYESWYRPDQQAVIVVGDIDVNRIEGKIKEMFSDIEMPANAPERTYEAVPDHKGTLYAIGSDPEQKTLLAEMMFITDPMPAEMKNTLAFPMQKYAERMIAAMLNERLSDIANKPDAPFAQASVDFGNYFLAKTKDAFSISVVAKDKDIVAPLQAAYREVLRAQRGGFTQSEYDRAKQDYLSAMETAYNNRASRESDSYVQEYVNNYVNGEPIPGLEAEYQIAQQLAMGLPLEMLNAMFAEAVTPDNRVLLVLSPEGEGYTLPTEAQFAAAFTSVDGEEIAAFVEEVKTEPLIPVAPVAGKIVATKTDKVWGTTVWTLSNGATVVVKPTKYKEDQILFYARSKTGWANRPASYANSILTLPLMGGTWGLGTYTSSDLKKYLAGKQVSVSPEFDDYTTALEGSSTPKDLNTFMEVLYMTFKNSTLDKNEFEATQKAYAGVLANQTKSPEFIFSRDFKKALYASPFSQMITSEAIEKASREQIEELAHSALANAAGYTFTFVGNVDLNVLKPLVETYIASLPGNAKNAPKSVTKFNPALFTGAGNKAETFTTPMSTPQTYVAIVAKAKGKYTVKDAQLASIAGQILSNRLLKTVREEMGAVYSIGASGSAARYDFWTYTMQSQFPMKPEMKKEVLDFIAGEFKAMESNIKPEELAPIKEFMVKSFTENKEKNEAWLYGLAGYQLNGVDTFNGNIEVMNSITVADVQNFMKRLNASGTYRTVVLDPEAAK